VSSCRKICPFTTAAAKNARRHFLLARPDVLAVVEAQIAAVRGRLLRRCVERPFQGFWRDPTASTSDSTDTAPGPRRHLPSDCGRPIERTGRRQARNASPGQSALPPPTGTRNGGGRRRIIIASLALQLLLFAATCLLDGVSLSLCLSDTAL
jgi:hypothetical protein